MSSLKELILPILIVAAVLGGIYSGIVTPTEAAGVGAFCVFLVALISRNRSWRNFRQALLATLRLTGMIVWILMAVTIFTNVYNALGAPELISRAIIFLPVGGFGVIILMQLSVFFLGMIMDDIALLVLVTLLRTLSLLILLIFLTHRGHIYILYLKVNKEISHHTWS